MARSHKALSAKAFATVEPTFEGGYPHPTLEAKVGSNLTATLVKLDEDSELGYCYRVTVTRDDRDNERVGEIMGWFDGFGCVERPNDAIHAVRRMVRAATYYS